MSYEIFLPLSHTLSLVTIKSLVLMTYRLNDIFCVCFQTNITEVKDNGEIKKVTTMKTTKAWKT